MERRKLPETGGLPRDPLVLGMLVLTFTTGIVDAVGYLALDRVFAGNMTGNVVILGMASVGADDLPVLGPTVALGGFLAGAAVGGRALRGVPGSAWGSRHTALLVTVGLLLAAVAVALFGSTRGDHLLDAVVAAGMAVAMGLQAATARHVAVSDVTTVVVTSTLTCLASDSWLGARRPQLWARRAAAVALIAAGAAVGAALLAVHPGWGVVAAAVLTLVVAVNVPVAVRRGELRAATTAAPPAVLSR